MTCAGNVMRFRNCSISKCFVYDGTHSAQLLGEQVPRLLRASDQNPQVFDAAGFLEFFDDSFGDEFRRLEVDMKMKLLHPLGGGGPDRCNFRSTNFPSVVVKFEEHFKEGVDPIDARENDPVIGMRILHEFGEFTKVARWFNSNDRQLDYICSKLTQLKTQLARLLAGSRYHDPLPKERARFEPV